MFGLGIPEIVLLLLIALVAFSPTLPAVGRSIGKALGSLRKSVS